jgi:hypothetical protein
MRAWVPKIRCPELIVISAQLFDWFQKIECSKEIRDAFEGKNAMATPTINALIFVYEAVSICVKELDFKSIRNL